MQRKESPCLRCRKVADPEKCDNKECPLWRHWFMERWDQMREEYAKLLQIPATEDPCKRCPLPAEYCLEPCRGRREWEARQ